MKSETSHGIRSVTNHGFDNSYCSIHIKVYNIAHSNALIMVCLKPSNFYLASIRFLPIRLWSLYRFLMVDFSKFCHQVEARLPRSEKLRGMVRAGIPHSLRTHLWMRLSGALEKKQKAETSYKEIVKASSSDLLMTSKQIEKVRKC